MTDTDAGRRCEIPVGTHLTGWCPTCRHLVCVHREDRTCEVCRAFPKVAATETENVATR